MSNFRVRFAPSPTGALHIGGVRTALYNYLLAKKHKGTFVLRIEDTDQARYVPGAEAYIMESLKWVDLIPDESPEHGGDYGPYRQSERRHLYGPYADRLVEAGHAYYAFDTPEELEAARQAERERGNFNFRYDSSIRDRMRNSLNLSGDEVKNKLAAGEPYAIRLKVPATGTVTINDRIRGAVVFQCEELDDKVILKTDGMPTYHLANVVDDYLMKITHVVRGEEWLSSTPHHILLYRFLGWEEKMPQFAHLPLILKPTGKGKLAKRDGARLGIPVFPISWEGETEKESFTGFREFGFDPRAVVNFLALLGWNPGTDQELFSMEELIDAFSLEKIGKAGARFDFDKAKWFNQQYIMSTPDAELAETVKPFLEIQGQPPDRIFLAEFCHLMKERVMLFTDFWESGYYFFEPVRNYDESTIAKKWRPDRRPMFETLASLLRALEIYQAGELEETVSQFSTNYGLKSGEVFPVLRIALTGNTQGPPIFEMMALMGQAEVDHRLISSFDLFDAIVEKSVEK